MSAYDLKRALPMAVQLSWVFVVNNLDSDENTNRVNNMHVSS
jgi:hypothetical protein